MHHHISIDDLTSLLPLGFVAGTVPTESIWQQILVGLAVSVLGIGVAAINRWLARLEARNTTRANRASTNRGRKGTPE